MIRRDSSPAPPTPLRDRVPPDQIDFRQVVGDERLDQIAHEVYGNAAYWRVIAEFNDLPDATALKPGRVLELPSRAFLEVDG